MTKLSKEAVQKLLPEQQEHIAKMELRRMQMKQELFERAQGRRGLGILGGIIEGVLIAVPGSLALLSLVFPRLLPFAVIAVSIEVGFLVARVNRRLDALMQLLDSDISNNAPESEH
jgi:hypothetical protein